MLLPILHDDALENITRQEIASAVGPTTEFTVDSLEMGPSSIETYFDEEVAAPWIVEKAIKADKDGYDAIIIDCMGDPAIHSVREAVKKPVVGPLMATTSIACNLGEKFSIVTVLRESIPLFKRKIREYGLEHRLASVRYVNVPVLELERRRDEVRNQLVEESIQAVNDGADSIILGCTGMIGMAKSMQQRLDIPVIDPGVAQVKYAELLVSLGLSHSPNVYPSPRVKKRIIPSQGSGYQIKTTEVGVFADGGNRRS
ncbi:MAG: AroM family protein [Nitrososphaerota archaeon]